MPQQQVHIFFANPWFYQLHEAEITQNGGHKVNHLQTRDAYLVRLNEAAPLRLIMRKLLSAPVHWRIEVEVEAPICATRVLDTTLNCTWMQKGPTALHGLDQLKPQ